MRPRFRTVAEAVAHVHEYNPRGDYIFQDSRGNETRYLFAELERATAQRAAALQELGLSKGDRVGLIVIEPEDFVLTFLGALRVGVVPVPLYPPMSFASLDAYADRTAGILSSAGARVLVASSKLQNLLWSLVDKVEPLEKLVLADRLGATKAEPDYPEIVPEDLAFLQFTSGSTAAPKGVMVTHGSLAANCEGIIIESLQQDPLNNEFDRAVSWLPLYHDMGLIGFVIAPLMHALPAVFIPTMRFIKKPSCWMETMSRHKATTTFAPNFALALATRRAKEAELDRWDLSNLRIVGCGAEPIQAETIKAFTDLLHSRCNMPLSAVMPAYGMAEATLAMSLKRAPELYKTLQLDPEVFAEEGRVVEPATDGPTAEHVSCGRAFAGHRMVAMNDADEILADGREGELCHSGPSVTPGYYNTPGATASTYRNGWLHTGDLGFVMDGEVYVTGRIKDLIIVNGRNIHPQAVEWCAAEIDGVRKGNAVAFSIPGAAGERLVLAFESAETDHAPLQRAVSAVIQKELSLRAHDIVVLPKGTLPKTSSGKLQRRKTREMYLQGTLGKSGSRAAGAKGSRMTVAKHVAQSVWSRAKAAATRR